MRQADLPFWYKVFFDEYDYFCSFVYLHFLLLQKRMGRITV